MRKIFILICVCAMLSLGSCTEKVRDDAAAHAAKEYYDSLVAGNVAHFIRGTYLPDTIPDSYREQLEDNARMFIARMNDEHHGINEVRILNCVNDTIAGKDGKSSVHTANAFLVLCFGDSLNEEIVVPMVEHRDRWLMR